MNIFIGAGGYIWAEYNGEKIGGFKTLQDCLWECTRKRWPAVKNIPKSVYKVRVNG